MSTALEFARIMVIRISFIFACFSGLSLLGCSSDDDASCAAQFGGNTSDTTKLGAQCAAVAPSPDAGPGGGYTLTLDVQSKHIQSLSVSIDLGAGPAPGMYSSETSAVWNAVGAFASNGDCQFSGGNAGVPSGSFTLTLDSIDAANSGAGHAHGKLELTTYVHAPPATDCGAGDLENVAIQF